MDGPSHYKEAERLLGLAEDAHITDLGGLLTAAQVHATLALAAATALGLDAPPREYDAWDAVCGVKSS